MSQQRDSLHKEKKKKGWMNAPTVRGGNAQNRTRGGETAAHEKCAGTPGGPRNTWRKRKKKGDGGLREKKGSRKNSLGGGRKKKKAKSIDDHNPDVPRRSRDRRTKGCPK